MLCNVFVVSNLFVCLCVYSDFKHTWPHNLNEFNILYYLVYIKIIVQFNDVLFVFANIINLISDFKFIVNVFL